MTPHNMRRSVAALATSLALSSIPFGTARAADGPAPVEVRGGTAAFEASTNIPAISIHGKSTALTGRAKIVADAGRLTIDELDATVPVKTLNTGMSLRDEHMRKHIFTTPDGRVPDLRFSGDHASCSGSDSESTCQVTGQLTVRGTARPFAIALKVTKNGGAFRAMGQGMLKLSEYGIPQPSQLGVSTSDDVVLRLDFLARPASPSASTGGAQ